MHLYQMKSARKVRSKTWDDSAVTALYVLDVESNKGTILQDRALNNRLGYSILPDLQSLVRDEETQDRDNQCRGHGQSGHKAGRDLAEYAASAIPEVGHKAAPVYNQQAKSGENSRKAETECEDPGQTKRHAVVCYRGEQHHKRGRAGNNAASDTQSKQPSGCDLLSIGGQMSVRLAEGAVRVGYRWVAMMMIVCHVQPAVAIVRVLHAVLVGHSVIVVMVMFMRC